MTRRQVVVLDEADSLLEGAESRSHVTEVLGRDVDGKRVQIIAVSSSWRAETLEVAQAVTRDRDTKVLAVGCGTTNAIEYYVEVQPDPTGPSARERLREEIFAKWRQVWIRNHGPFEPRL